MDWTKLKIVIKLRYLLPTQGCSRMRQWRGGTWSHGGLCCCMPRWQWWSRSRRGPFGALGICTNLHHGVCRWHEICHTACASNSGTSCFLWTCPDWMWGPKPPYTVHWEWVDALGTGPAWCCHIACWERGVPASYTSTDPSEFTVSPKVCTWALYQSLGLKHCWWF